MYMSAMFVGAFSSFEVAADYSSGMGNRLMLGAPRRLALVGGYLIVAVTRCVVALVVIWGIALATGMSVKGGSLDIAALVALALLLNVATALYGAGVALRLQSIAAGTLILIPLFMSLFLTPVFLPRDQLSGWLKTVTGVNPLTALMEAGRGFLAADPTSVGLAFGVAGGLVILFGTFAVRGMAKAERGSGGGRRARRATRHGRSP
jgi:ABC-2 type transport system permease protein